VTVVTGMLVRGVDDAGTEVVERQRRCMDFVGLCFGQAFMSVSLVSSRYSRPPFLPNHRQVIP
jgi:hypothetical protein